MRIPWMGSAAAIAAFAAFALPAWATPLAPANISTSLDQCEVQLCGSLPPLASYDGTLSGFSTETVGEGASVSASGFSSPSLTTTIPVAGANADISAELTYLIEVVPTSGNAATVQLGVNAVGSISTTTVGHSPGDPTSDASAFTLVQLQLSSDDSGTVVFNDVASIVYESGTDDSGACTSVSNTSSTRGAGTLGPASVSCGTSTASGGFNETGTYTIATNAPFLVTMQADLNLGTDNNGDAVGPGTVQGQAVVDPIFTVPTGFALEISPGVGNSLPVSSVPEPTTWTILAAGTGFLMIVVKRRRQDRPGARAIGRLAIAGSTIG